LNCAELKNIGLLHTVIAIVNMPMFERVASQQP